MMAETPPDVNFIVQHFRKNIRPTALTWPYGLTSVPSRALASMAGGWFHSISSDLV
jgi:hypothetical protein